MPLSKHFGGKGAKVMASMRGTYPTKKKAEEVFYATENKRKSKKKKSHSKKSAGSRNGGMTVGMKDY